MNAKGFSCIVNNIKEKDYIAAHHHLMMINYEQLTTVGQALYERCKNIISINDHIKYPEPLRPEGTLADYANRTITPGISIVSCCMNRNDNLAKSLASWIKLPVDEIVIVDWSSTTPVSDSIAHIKDNRVKVVRVENEPRWVLTYGFNVGLRFASYSKVFKFDADIEVTEDFILKNEFSQGEYIRGSWQSALAEGMNSQIFVNGSFGAYKKDLAAIGYYNEYIRTYGWDDSDLYERLSSQAGLRARFLSFESITHLHQEQEQRLENQEVVKNHFLEKIAPTELNNLKNKFIARTYDFWSYERMQNYRISKQRENHWTCERVTTDASLPNGLSQKADLYAASLFIWNHNPEVFQHRVDCDTISRFMHNEYSCHIPLSDTLDILGIQDQSRNILTIASAESLQSFSNRCHAQAISHKAPVIGVLLTDKHTRIISLTSGYPVILLGIDRPTLEEVNKSRVARHKESINCQSSLVSSAELAKLQQRLHNVIFVDAQHGLGNRIRAIGSAAAIAEATSRELVIVWEPDHHCECEFGDLFEYDAPVINHSLLNLAKEYIPVFNYMEIEEGAEKDKPIKLEADRAAYLRAAYTFNSEYSHWEAENRFIRALKPAAAVMDLVESVDTQNCMAVHIRMEAGQGLDHNTYDSVENWTQEGHDQLHFWREKSHYSHFVKRIDQLIQEDSQLNIFLATDLPETYQKFEQYYGSRLKYLQRDVYDRSKQQIIYALADAMLLSRCNRFLGSTWSSFSEIAMRLSTSYSKIEMSGTDF